MALTSLTYAPPVRRGTRPLKPDYELLDAAVALAEAGKPVESITKVFQHLFPAETIPDLATQTFSFTQGSSRVSARVDGDDLVVTVPLIRLPSGGGAIAALRYVLTKISGSGQLHQPRLRGEEVYLEFRDKLTRLHPAKVLEILRRMPVEADNNDDWLIGQFSALSLERAPITPVDADEAARCEAIWRSHWGDVDELVKESQRKRSQFFLNEVTAYALYRIRFALPLTGFLAARLDESASTFNDGNEDSLKREAALAKCAKEMQAVSTEELRKNLGHVVYAISPFADGTPAVLSGYFESGGYIDSVDKLRNTGKSYDAALALICTYNYLLARHSWPGEVEAALQAGLALVSGKPWREAANALFEHAKELATKYGGGDDDDDDDDGHAAAAGGRAMTALDIENMGVFQVFTGGGTGTGFLIDKHLLVTNCHVVEPYRSVAIELRNKRRIVGTVRRIHPKRDLAVVELSQPLEGELLTLASSDDLKPKQEVHIVGYPVGLPLSVTEGVISNPKQLLDGQHFVQTDAAINPGNSGGPILDEQKRIVAVTTCKLTSADMVGFGIPGTDVRTFVEGFRQQTATFGVMCPSCDVLLESAERYCNSCGSDLESLELGSYFDPPEDHPIVKFVESALASAKVDPVLARHGAQNWSFYSGSAPIKIWCCCSEHLCFSSPLAQPGKQRLGELFRFLLSAEHAPFAFDMYENMIRLNLTFHVSDVFAADQDEASRWISEFVASADRYDNVLVQTYGCEPAPETQLTFLKEQTR